MVVAEGGTGWVNWIERMGGEEWDTGRCDTGVGELGRGVADGDGMMVAYEGIGEGLGGLGVWEGKRGDAAWVSADTRDGCLVTGWFGPCPRAARCFSSGIYPGTISWRLTEAYRERAIFPFAHCVI